MKIASKILVASLFLCLCFSLPGFVAMATVSGQDAGSWHTIAIKTDGSLYAWGNNYHRQLGVGSDARYPSPVRIGSSTWRVASAGAAHTVAINTDGSLWAWGRNDKGQLGDGTTTDRSFPTRIGTGADWQVISAGAFYTVAIKKDGSFWAWGTAVQERMTWFQADDGVGRGSQVRGQTSSAETVGSCPSSKPGSRAWG